MYTMKFIETIQQYEKDMIDTEEADKIQQEIEQAIIDSYDDHRYYTYYDSWPDDDEIVSEDIPIPKSPTDECKLRRLGFDYCTAYIKKIRSIIILMKIISKLPKDLQSIVLSYDKHLVNCSYKLLEIQYSNKNRDKYDIRITKLKNNYTNKIKYRIDLVALTKYYSSKYGKPHYDYPYTVDRTFYYIKD